MQGHRLGSQGPSRSPPKPIKVLVGKGPLLSSSTSAGRPANYASAIPYTIFRSSPCSPGYGAENLLIEKPSDLSSRWSASSPAQVVSGEEKATDEAPYVILELKHLSVLRGVVFGKAEKAHPCNAQWVKIYAGPTPHSMNEVFVGNLRNDGQSELKGVRSSAWVWTGNMERKTGIKPKRRDELVFPVKFVKICPGPAYEPRFNTSLWYVEPFGNSDPKYVNNVHKAWNKAQDLLANRVILKHLRAQRLDAPFNCLMQSLLAMPDQPEHILEHPILTRLFGAVVREGDFQAGEAIIDELVTNDMMSQEAWRSQTCKLQTLEVTSSSVTPESRDGPGTAMKDDSVYMFGGHRDKLLLDDFWVGRILNSQMTWDKLQRTEADDPWPPAMACQYMIALDTHVAMIDVYPASAWIHTGDGHALRRDPGPTTTSVSGRNHGLIAPEMLDTLMVFDDPKHQHNEALADSTLWLYNLESRKWTEHALPQSVSASGESVELCVHGLDVCPGGLEVEFHTSTKFHRIFMDPRTGEWKSSHESDWKGQKAYDAEDPASQTFDLKYKEKYGVEPYSEKDGVQITWDPTSYEMLVLRRSTEGLLEIDPFDWYNREFRRGTVKTTQVFPSSGYWAEILTSETERDGIWIQQGEQHIVCERVDFGRVQAFTRTCVQAIRKHRFSEMVDNSDTMGALEYLKGPLQDVLEGEATDIQLLASYILKGSPMKSDTERWYSRLKLFDLILALVDDRFAEPIDSLTDLLPV